MKFSHFVAAVANQEKASDGGELLARTAFVDGVTSGEHCASTKVR
jgi:hypothetical protein